MRKRKDNFRRMVNDDVDRTAIIARCSPFILFLLIAMCHGQEIRAQESAGQADVATQAYYLGGSGQHAIQTGGMAVNSTQFIEGLGLMTANVEGYGGQGLRTGNLFMGLQGTPLLGWHWDFNLGQDAAYDNGLICGGQLDVFVEPVLPVPGAFIFGAGHI